MAVPDGTHGLAKSHAGQRGHYRVAQPPKVCVPDVRPHVDLEHCVRPVRSTDRRHVAEPATPEVFRDAGEVPREPAGRPGSPPAP